LPSSKRIKSSFILLEQCRDAIKLADRLLLRSDFVPKFRSGASLNLSPTGRSRFPVFRAESHISFPHLNNDTSLWPQALHRQPKTFYANSSIHLRVYVDDQGVGEIESLKNALEDIAKCKQMIDDPYELRRIINKMVEPIGSDGDCKRLGHVASGD
jgi:hypothetical protein